MLLYMPEHRLRELREESHLTKRQLAQAVGVNETTVGRWERHGRIPHPRIEQLAEFFGVSVPFFLGFDNGDNGNGQERAAA